MKFEETFTAYLMGDEGKDLNECCHFAYKRLKKGLNICRHLNDDDGHNQILPHQSCQRCDEMFFSELKTEASKMDDCFSLRVGKLVNLHLTSGMQRFISCFFQWVKDDQQTLMDKGWMLIQFVVMNAIALRKILHKYDKVHKSSNGTKFKSKLVAERLEITQSPWLIELLAFYMNLNGSNSVTSNKLFGPLSFDLNITDEESLLTVMLPNSEKLEHDLTCAICLDIVFQPYALRCGHVFCKSCACSAASVLIIEGLKSASQEARCPLCRENGVYANAVCMSELASLLQERCKERYKARVIEEREKVVKQTKEYWEEQTNMKFEEIFTTYLAEEGKELNKCCHFSYKRLKKDLNFCRLHKHSIQIEPHGESCHRKNYYNSNYDILLIKPTPICTRFVDLGCVLYTGQDKTDKICSMFDRTFMEQAKIRFFLFVFTVGCDQMFFSELKTEASKMADCFSLRVRKLVHLHLTTGTQRFISCFFQCVKNDQQSLMEKGWMLIQFVVMNVIALRKLLNKYDKVHKSVNGAKFKSRLAVERLDITQSPWLIELVAFYMNLKGSNVVMSDKLFGPLSFDLNTTDEVSLLTVMLPDSEKLEHDLTCAVCLDIVFQPYALKCGHLFCKSCACSAASVLIIKGLKSASQKDRCPICREVGISCSCDNCIK
ncbi:hypothetical protein OSB04_009738 [Centaurea solstitialis]|uniref:RING-type E3 ubiquitin transferase n=1 Tax=Centaurea solstitialis TaxID=347529 RepID=A0AA38WMF0_9ASTR|nr:hypothetical protein OSB04_009738 [Centaurea solstitialis]